MINLFMNLDHLTMYAFITLLSFIFYFSSNKIFDEYDWESTRSLSDLCKLITNAVLNTLATPVKVQVYCLNKFFL